jgi:hypothetical protein
MCYYDEVYCGLSGFGRWGSGHPVRGGSVSMNLFRLGEMREPVSVLVSFLI